MEVVGVVGKSVQHGLEGGREAAPVGLLVAGLSLQFSNTRKGDKIIIY